MNDLVWITYVKNGEEKVSRGRNVGPAWHNELGDAVIFPVIAWMPLESKPDPYQPADQGTDETVEQFMERNRLGDEDMIRRPEDTQP